MAAPVAGVMAMQYAAEVASHPAETAEQYLKAAAEVNETYNKFYNVAMKQLHRSDTINAKNTAAFLSEAKRIKDELCNLINTMFVSYRLPLIEIVNRNLIRTVTNANTIRTILEPGIRRMIYNVFLGDPVMKDEIVRLLRGNCFAPNRIENKYIPVANARRSPFDAIPETGGADRGPGSFGPAGPAGPAGSIDSFSSRSSAPEQSKPKPKPEDSKEAAPERAEESSFLSGVESPPERDEIPFVREQRQPERIQSRVGGQGMSSRRTRSKRSKRSQRGGAPPNPAVASTTTQIAIDNIFGFADATKSIFTDLKKPKASVPERVQEHICKIVQRMFTDRSPRLLEVATDMAYLTINNDPVIQSKLRNLTKNMIDSMFNDPQTKEYFIRYLSGKCARQPTDAVDPSQRYTQGNSYNLPYRETASRNPLAAFTRLVKERETNNI